MDVKIGDHVAALRSHNKAVRLSGTVESVNLAGVTIRLDENPDWLETVHLADVEPLDVVSEIPPAEEKTTIPSGPEQKTEY